jgi:hypothetical protein
MIKHHNWFGAPGPAFAYNHCALPRFGGK